jgi:hypothetical protein
VGVTVYGVTILFTRLMFSVLVSYSRREHLRLERADDPDLHEARRKSGVTLVGYAVTILIGLLLPIVAIVLYFALAVFLVVPFKTVVREVLGRGHAA